MIWIARTADETGQRGHSIMAIPKLLTVTAALGVPTSDIRDSSGLRVLGCSYVSTQVSGATFIPVVGAFAGGASGQARIVTFTFGSDEILVRHAVMSSQFGC